MNSKQTLVVIGTAALCGLAFAQTPKPAAPPADRIDALEKEVAALRALANNLPPPVNEDVAGLRKELTETRILVNQLITWTSAQAEGAAELTRILDEAEVKGFVFGINPDSRTVLLGGWRSFAAGLQKNAPTPIIAANPSAKAVREVKPLPREIR